MGTGSLELTVARATRKVEDGPDASPGPWSEDSYPVLEVRPTLPDFN